MGTGHQTPKLLVEKNMKGAVGERSVSSHIYEAISSWKIYHFHDTSAVAPMRRSETVDDCGYLRFDAANLAPYLLYLRENKAKPYEQIIEVIRLVTPFFDDFILKILSW